MKRYGVPLAALFCLALSACPQPMPPQPPVPPAPPPPPVTVSSMVQCPASAAFPAGDLLTHVNYTRFTPGSPFTMIPTPDTSTSIDNDIQTDLAAAFNLNPIFSQNELCPLDGIFINAARCMNYAPSSCSQMLDTDIADNSWGFRTSNLSATPGQKYIAISLGLWRNNQCRPGHICAPAFQDYHARLVNALLDRSVKPTNAHANKPQLSFSASTNTSGLSVLAAIAHERGHVYWFETFVKTPGDQNVSNTTTFCNPPFYPGGSWQGATVGIPDGRFVQFGHLSPNSPVKISNLPILLPISDSRPTGEVLDGVYASRLFPSLLAAYSPDEDFVEAFEWSALRDAGLTDLTVAITGFSQHQEIILSHGVAAPQVEAKLACFDALSRAIQRR
jgi:hypothetical protein